MGKKAGRDCTRKTKKHNDVKAVSAQSNPDDDAATSAAAKECLRLFAESDLRRFHRLACSLADEDDDSRAFGNVMLAFLFQADPKLFAHSQPFETYLWDEFHRRAAGCDSRAQKWMVNLVHSVCDGDNNSCGGKKVKAFCHYFLAMVLGKDYGDFPFTSEEQSSFHAEVSAQSGDPRALTAVGGFQNVKKAASLGFCTAQRNLGMMYLHGAEYPGGPKVPLNATEGMKLLRIAVEKGDAMAQTFLAKIYIQNQNPVEAVKLFKLAAAQGYVDAEIGLAGLYISGPECVHNLPEGIRLLKMAEPVFNKWKEGRESSDPAEWATAFCTLARLTWFGVSGLKRDTKEGMRLYHLAWAALQNSPIEYKFTLVADIAKLYEEGRGAPDGYKDAREAARWWKLMLNSDKCPSRIVLNFCFFRDTEQVSKLVIHHLKPSKTRCCDLLRSLAADAKHARRARICPRDAGVSVPIGAEAFCSQSAARDVLVGRVAPLRRDVQFHVAGMDGPFLGSSCGDKRYPEKVRSFCHFFLGFVLDTGYPMYSFCKNVLFEFTDRDRSQFHVGMAAQGGDPRALTAVGGFNNVKKAASLGYCPAQRELGMMYLGEGDKQKLQ
ncbi:hypothetical protein Pelo_4157 [Pelomyxa schiedti]|nr:hypothetical protein Pelo_4157 [Pelomyxa schiedti]